jgi:hypothetical protein
MPLWTGLVTAAAVVAAVAGTATARPVAMRGVIEGYYGRPWTGEARRDVIRFLGSHGMNTFVYAPKNDPFHRQHWRDAYPAAELADMADSAAAARKAKVGFVYALSPGLDVCYACDDDFSALTAKLAQVAGAGIRRFALLFDDAPDTLAAPADVARYGGSDAAALARAQADLANRTVRWLRRQRLGRLLLIVPTDYAGDGCEAYHAALKEHLARGLAVGWTGSGVLAPTITAVEARARAKCVGHPVVLWDNIPVNDTVLSNNLHLGPLTGRDPQLPAALRGYLLNPMTQAHASLVTLGTAAAYLRHPHRYDPERAWRETLAELGGPGFAVLAENTRSSALDLDDARPLATAVAAVEATWNGPDWGQALAALAAEEGRQTAAAEEIDSTLDGTALGTEIAPWVHELGEHAARGTQAVTLLQALKPAFVGLEAQVIKGTLYVHGRVKGPDSNIAMSLGPDFAAEAAAVAQRIEAPPVGPYVACLGDLLGADIGFCPQFGLNVHGKALFFFIRSQTDLRIVTDRNVHDRLIELVGRLYATWAAGRSPGSDALSLTLSGAPIPLAEDGAFSATTPMSAGGRVRVVVSTAGGLSTAVVVP